MIRQSISAGTANIKENIQVIRAKFRPLLEADQYIEDVERLLTVVPKMLDNVEAMADELDNAYNILQKSPKKSG
ncbi:hypothetical protein GF377_01215 [candidate division GN15 bacterium]|nr:hypothetical protein [candidate division GN15 bacterium]